MNYNEFHILAGFNRERIPERVTHAKGAGAFGYFETSYSMRDFTECTIFQEPKKRIPVFVRFSNYRGEKGSPDTIRDPRGMAIKFYTDEGNWDLTGNNIPVFFINDPTLLPEFAHSQKRNPQTNLFDADLMWKFFAKYPESLHAVLFNFSERGIPASYRNMHSFSCNTYRFYNKDKHFFVRFSLLTNEGIKNLNEKDAEKLASHNPDFYTTDLYSAIAREEFPSWTLYAQIQEVEKIENFTFDPFDCTKVWPHSIAPLMEIGKLVLDKNVNNYFRDVEQAAFSPSNLVPGIGISPDPILQARLLAYPDAARYRLGVNYEEISVNKPVCPFHRDTQDGKMRISENFAGRADQYHSENFVNRFQDNFSYSYNRKFAPDPYSQPRELWKILSEKERQNLRKNLMNSLQLASKETIQKMFKHLVLIDSCLLTESEENQIIQSILL